MEKIEERLSSAVDQTIEKNLKPIVEQEAKDQTLKHVKLVVAQLREAQAYNGFDKTGLTRSQKLEFCEEFRKAANGIMNKTAQTSESPEKGGILIPSEVHNGIMRVAEDFGYAMKLATKFPMAGSGELSIPNYQGTTASQVWAYLGEDEEGSESNVDLKNARLIPKKAIKLIRLDNTLLKKSTVALADWLIAIMAESLAYTVDYQAFTGIGAPFVGILNNDNVGVVTMSSGDTAFTDISVDYLRSLYANVNQGARNGGAFFMHLSVWNNVRNLKDSQGDYVFKANNNIIDFNGAGNPLAPVGMMDGKYPVYAIDLLPSTTAVSTKFVVFGNMRFLAYGETGPMEVARSEHATVGSKSTFAAYQTAIRLLHEHAVTVANPKGFAVLKTAAS